MNREKSTPRETRIDDAGAFALVQPLVALRSRECACGERLTLPIELRSGDCRWCLSDTADRTGSSSRDTSNRTEVAL